MLYSLKVKPCRRNAGQKSSLKKIITNLLFLVPISFALCSRALTPNAPQPASRVSLITRHRPARRGRMPAPLDTPWSCLQKKSFFSLNFFHSFCSMPHWRVEPPLLGLRSTVSTGHQVTSDLAFATFCNTMKICLAPPSQSCRVLCVV